MQSKFDPGSSTPRPQRKQLKELGLFTLIITDFIGFTGLGGVIGYFLWNRWPSFWWGSVLLTLLGLSFAVYRLYRLTQKYFE